MKIGNSNEFVCKIANGETVDNKPGYSEFHVRADSLFHAVLSLHNLGIDPDDILSVRQREMEGIDFRQLTMPLKKVR